MAKSYTLNLSDEEVQTLSKIVDKELEAAEQELVSLADGRIRVSEEAEAVLFCRAAEFDAIARKIEGALMGIRQ